MGGINLAQGVCDTPVPAPVEAGSHRRHPRRPQHLHAPGRHHPPAQRHRCEAAARLRPPLRPRNRSPGRLAALPPASTPPPWPCSIPATKSCSSSRSTATTSPRSTPCASSRCWSRWPSRTWRSTPTPSAPRVTPRTRAILLNTPANPSGKVFTQAETEAVCQRLPRARPVSLHRRNLRVLRLRRRAPHLLPPRCPA